MRPKQLRVEKIASTKYIELCEVYFQDQNGKEKKWSFLKRKQPTKNVIILAVTEKKEIILVQQYRPALNAETLEFPAGVGDFETESTESIAKRELEEETGYISTQIEDMETFPSSTSFSSDFIHYAVAHDSKLLGDKRAEDENIQVFCVAHREIEQFLNQKKHEKVFITHHLYSGLYLLEKYVWKFKT